MRFSLKWTLAGVAYVAVAAAAFSQQTWVYADILWAAALLAMVWATLTAVLRPGKARAAATGFLLTAGAFLMCLVVGLLLGGNAVPTSRILIAAGYEQSLPQAIYYNPVPIAPQSRYAPYSSSPTSGVSVAPAVAIYPTPATAVPVAVAPAPARFVDFAQYVRAGNAVGTMLLGGVGLVLGLAAYKLARREVESQISPRSVTGG